MKRMSPDINIYITTLKTLGLEKKGSVFSREHMCVSGDR